MKMVDEITNGISAHGMWKHRIVEAINTGQSEWNPVVVRQDNQCDFGKWLYSCSLEDKSSPHHRAVTELHAKFHKSAANVLELAIAGKQKEAKSAISMQSEYRNITVELTKEMMAWKNSAT